MATGFTVAFFIFVVSFYTQSSVGTQLQNR